MFVLIIVFVNASSPSINTEFTSYESCEKARQQIVASVEPSSQYPAWMVNTPRREILSQGCYRK